MVSLVRMCRYLQVHTRSCVNYETTEDNEEWFCRSCIAKKEESVFGYTTKRYLH